MLWRQLLLIFYCKPMQILLCLLQIFDSLISLSFNFGQFSLHTSQNLRIWFQILNRFICLHFALFCLVCKPAQISFQLLIFCLKLPKLGFLCSNSCRFGINLIFVSACLCLQCLYQISSCLISFPQHSNFFAYLSYLRLKSSSFRVKISDSVFFFFELLLQLFNIQLRFLIVLLELLQCFVPVSVDHQKKFITLISEFFKCGLLRSHTLFQLNIFFFRLFANFSARPMLTLKFGHFSIQNN